MSDFYRECYDGVAQQKMSPEDFTNVFCRLCRNQECKRSGQGQTRWLRRVLTQQERLLDNPKYADPNDPRYKDITDQDFKDLFRQAVALEIADIRGDWEPVSAADVAAYAAGTLKPAAFQTPPPPVEEPEVKESEALEDDMVIEWEVRIPASDGPPHEVSLGGPLGEVPAWVCSCRGFRFKQNCKHVKQAKKVYSRSRQMKLDEKPEKPVGPPHFQAPSRPTPQATVPSPQPIEVPVVEESGHDEPISSEIHQVSRNLPTAGNTRVPAEGLMIGGDSPPPEPEVHDPWAVPGKPKNVVEVGARIRMGHGKSPEDPT